MIFSLPFLRVELMRQLRNPFTLVFTVGMPVLMYLLFGANAEYGQESAGNGNVAFYVMASMAAFGTAVAMTSASSFAATEVGQGWGRQIAMTPLSMTGYTVVKLVMAVTIAAASTLIVFIVGALTGAKADDLWRWFAVVALILVGGLMFGLFGLGVGLAFNSDSAASLSSITITFFGFFGNVFMPLEGIMLTIAHYTPMYGYVALVRWPITEGVLVTGGSDELWQVLLNFGVYAILFAALARFGVLRSRRRR